MCDTNQQRKEQAINLHTHTQMVLKRINNSSLSLDQNLPSLYTVAIFWENSVNTKTVQKYSVLLSKWKVHLLIKGFFHPYESVYFRFCIFERYTWSGNLL